MRVSAGAGVSRQTGQGAVRGPDCVVFLRGRPLSIDRPEVSIVVPVHNEAGNVAGLIAEIAAAMDGRAYEMVFVNDASRDDTLAQLIALKPKYPMLRVLTHRQNAGQSRSIASGVRKARAAIVATLDGDGQNDPADLPDLINQLIRDDAPHGLALIQGHRASRKDTWSKRLASRIANAVRGGLLRDDTADSGCGAKAFRREAFLQLPYFDHMHRFMPALMKAEGFAVENRPVNHRQRGAGQSNYTNFGRALAAIPDLAGVMWLARRRRNPRAVDEV